MPELFPSFVKFTPIKTKFDVTVRHNAQRGKTSSHWSHKSHFWPGFVQSLEFLKKILKFA